MIQAELFVHQQESFVRFRRFDSIFARAQYEGKSVIVCRTAPPLKAELLKNESLHRSDTRLGNHIHLRGYQLNSSNLSAGHMLTVTLFWQSDSQLAKDYHVFVHLLDAGGQLVVQHDRVPVHRERPPWSW